VTTWANGAAGCRGEESMSNAPKLSRETQELLREVVSKYIADDGGRLMQESPDKWLSPLRVRVRDAVGQELAATGFDASYAPTARGQMLESIIDFLNRLEFGLKAN
jgi:hypothetical protein